MKAAILHGPNDLRIEDITPQLTMGPNEVMLKVAYVTICGTDVHAYKGNIPARTPVVIGHEYAGEIFQTGSNVEGLSAGDRVTGSYAASCGACKYCTMGKPQLCEDRILFGLNYDGSFTSFMRVPRVNRTLVKIPDEMDYRTAALIPDMFLTALYAVEKGDVRPGSTVLITGLGAVGLSALIAAKIAGASKVIGVDVRDKPLKVAQEFGADFVIDSRQEKNLAERVNEITGESGVDVVLEASGAPPVVKAALDSVKPFGKYLQVAIVEKPVEMDLRYVTSLEKTLIGVLNPGSTVYIKKAIDVIQSGRIDLRKLLTHEFSLEEAGKAFEVADKKIGDPLKVGVKIGQV